MRGELIENSEEEVETDNAVYTIRYSVKFVDGRFRCVARLRYDYQSWRADPIHKQVHITENKDNVQHALQDTINSCKNAIESMESVADLDLNVSVE